jgi:hypothetical protein
MAQSLAEKYRRHREVMELALQLRVTPKEAEAIMAQRAARARWEVTNQRLSARMRAFAAPLADQEMAQERALPYWKQGDLA